MNGYLIVCTIILRFAALTSVLFGLLGFVYLFRNAAGLETSGRYTDGQALSSGIFYLLLGVGIFFLSKPLAKVLCWNLEGHG
jgi:hypothetical protein